MVCRDDLVYHPKTIKDFLTRISRIDYDCFSKGLGLSPTDTMLLYRVASINCDREFLLIFSIIAPDGRQPKTRMHAGPLQHHLLTLRRKTLHKKMTLKIEPNGADLHLRLHTANHHHRSPQSIFASHSCASCLVTNVTSRPPKAMPDIIIYAGHVAYKLNDHVTAIPWNAM